MKRLFIEPSVRDSIITLWQDGLRPKQIVEALEDVSMNSVTTIVRQYKNSLLGRKTPHAETVVAMTSAGKKPADIAAALGLSQTTVRNILHAHRLMTGGVSQDTPADPPVVSLKRRRAGVSDRNYQIWLQYTVENQLGPVIAEQYAITPARVYQILQDVVSYFTMLDALPPEDRTEAETNFLSAYKTRSPR